MRPLEGVRVVAVEQAVAVPFASRHLADLGADVIKVERADGGDFARQYDASVNGGLSTHFAWLNRSKRSIALDLRSAEGRQTLERLVADADVFLHNLGPGAMDRLGFGAQRLRAELPRLVIAELSGFGADGPMRDRKAYDLLIQAEAGVASITGSPEQPAKTGIPIADIAAGTYLVQGVLAALLARGRTGEGSHLQLSLFDSMVEWMGYPVYRTLYEGTPPPRCGLAHPTVVPYDAYPAADGGSVLIGVQNDRGWRALVEHVLEAPEYLEDERTATNVARTANREFVDGLVAKRTRTFTAEELIARLNEAGVANGRLNDVPGLLAHPQLVERGRRVKVESPVGTIEAILPPLISDTFSPRMDPIPAVGEHGDEILAELDRAVGEQR